MLKPRAVRRLVVVVAVVASVLTIAPGGVPSASAAETVTVNGRGWGHGRGLGQWGAFGYATGMAGTPWSSAEILDHFYGGTAAGTVPANSTMSVRLVSRDGASTVVRNPEGSMSLRGSDGSTQSISQPLVRIAVSGTGAFTVAEGSSCSGPWSSVRSVTGTSLTVAAGTSQASTFAYGTATDQVVVGDWNGDGVDSPGVFRDGVWYLRNSNSGGVADISLSYGRPGDTPVVGDWNGDGVDTVGVRRNNVYYLRDRNSSGVADKTIGYGLSTDTPVVGDWDGNGTDTLGIRRGNAYFLRNANTTGTAQITYGYGTASDHPVVGDWDGNGTDTPGVARPNGSGFDFLLRNANSSGPAQKTVAFAYGGTPLAGSWNGGAVSSVGSRDGQTFHLAGLGSGSSADSLQLCTGSGWVAYRGVITAVNYSGLQRTVNELPIEQYLRGVVPREVPASWGTANGGTGMAALEAQAVAARSYSYAENRYPYAKTCDTTSCQVYGGRGAETTNTDTAIAHTANVVRKYPNGSVAKTEFSSSTGGHTIGAPIAPYESVEDLGDAVAGNTRHTWTMQISLSTIGDRFCGGGTAQGAAVVERLAADGYRRAATVRVSCASGAVDVTGDQFRLGLGLYSTWFSIGEGAGETGPGVFRAGTFHLRSDNSSGVADVSFAYGPSGGHPLTGDWDGDGVETVGYRTGQSFHLRNSNSAGADDVTIASYGRLSDIPIVADYDGDGDDDVGVRRGNEMFFHGATSSPVMTVGGLEASDQVVFGDWDADGVDEIGWLRGTTFHLDGIGSFSAPAAGTPVSVRVGTDARASVGVVTNGAWKVLVSPSAGASVLSFQFGTSGDAPVTGQWSG